MTITWGPGIYIHGLHSDPKPKHPQLNSIFVEDDTHNEYVFDGKHWKLSPTGGPSGSGGLKGLHVIDDDKTVQTGRKGLLQIFALDNLILQNYNVLIKRLNKKFDDPYKFTPDEFDLENIQKACRQPPRGSRRHPTPPRPDILCSAFRIYSVSISLQKIFSYIFINTERINGLQSVDIDAISSSLGVYGTTDKVSKEDLDYMREVRDAALITELENATSGTPSASGAVEEIIKSIVQCIGDFSNQDQETILPIEYRDMENEFEEEITLINALFEYPLPVDQVIHAAGLENVFKTFDTFLPNNAIEILDSPIFDGVINAWSKLFHQPQPELIDKLVSNMPMIRDRFITTTTTSVSQQDQRYNALRLIVDFLDGARLDGPRIEELKNLASNPLATNFLKTFRSLLLVVVSGDTGKWFTESGGDPAKRLNFLYVVYWLLTPLRELNVLFRLATTRLDPTAYGLDSTVIPAAMFPGNLDLSGGGLQIGISVQSDFDNDSRRITMKMDKVKRPGRLDVSMMQAGNRWLI